jgi:hypothetical protein
VCQAAFWRRGSSLGHFSKPYLYSASILRLANSESNLNVAMFISNNYYNYLFQLRMGFTLWQGYYSKTQHTNTHVTQNDTPHQNSAHKLPTQFRTYYTQ